MARFLIAFMCAMLLVGWGPAPAAAQTRIVAVVNGAPITNYDVGQRERLLRLTGGRGNLRQQALDELIDETLKTLAYKGYGITVSEGDVDEAISDIAQRVKMSRANLDKVLRQAGTSMGSLEDRMRAQIGFNRLVRRRFQSAATVTEQDLVAALLKDDTKEKLIDAAEYQLEEVTIALPREPSAQRLAQANRRAEELRGQFTSCSEGVPLMKRARNVVVRPLGRRMETDLPQNTREALEDVAVGRLSPPVRTSRGLSLYAVCDKKIVKSANAAMKALEPDLTAERGEQFSKQFVRQLRRDAVVELRE